MSDAYVCYRTGWTIFDVRQTPKHIIAQMQVFWRLENEQQRYQNKKIELANKR